MEAHGLRDEPVQEQSSHEFQTQQCPKSIFDAEIWFGGLWFGRCRVWVGFRVCSLEVGGKAGGEGG